MLSTVVIHAVTLPTEYDASFRRALPVLERYQSRRRVDNLLMQSGMDLFYAGFSNDLGPLRVLRNVGLMAAQRAGVLKRQALKYALGL